MMTLQKHINTVNGNLASLSGWLTDNLQPEGGSLLELNTDNAYQAHLRKLVQGSNVSMGTVQHALGQVVEDTTALVSQLHADESADKSVNVVAVMPVLDRVANVVGQHAARAKKALTNGNAKQAQRNLWRASRTIRVAQALMQKRSRNSIWDSRGVAFQRKAEVMLGPSHRRLRNEFHTVGNLHLHSMTFSAMQKTLMANVTDLASLSDEVELNQATDLMLRFEDISEEMHGIGADYMDHAWHHLDARNAVLKEMRDAISSDSCNTETTVDSLGQQMANLDVAESDHVQALHKAWRNTASGLTRMVNLLVDGGLLLHHMRLAAVGAEHKDGRTLDHQIEHSLSKHSGLLVQQASKAFDLSQLLSNMWSDGMMDAPQDELVQMRNAWGRLKTASRQLQEKLKAGGELQQALVMLASRHSKAGSLLQTHATARDFGKYLDPIALHGKAL